MAKKPLSYIDYEYILLSEVEEEVLTLKSDHEFSPESEVDDEEALPIRRARTKKG